MGWQSLTLVGNAACPDLTQRSDKCLVAALSLFYAVMLSITILSL